MCENFSWEDKTFISLIISESNLRTDQQYNVIKAQVWETIRFYLGINRGMNEGLLTSAGVTIKNDVSLKIRFQYWWFFTKVHPYIFLLNLQDAGQDSKISLQSKWSVCPSQKCITSINLQEYSKFQLSSIHVWHLLNSWVLCHAPPTSRECFHSGENVI